MWKLHILKKTITKKICPPTKLYPVKLGAFWIYQFRSYMQLECLVTRLLFVGILPSAPDWQNSPLLKRDVCHVVLCLSYTEPPRQLQCPTWRTEQPTKQSTSTRTDIGRTTCQPTALDAEDTSNVVFCNRCIGCRSECKSSLINARAHLKSSPMSRPWLPKPCDNVPSAHAVDEWRHTSLIPVIAIGRGTQSINSLLDPMCAIGMNIGGVPENTLKPSILPLPAFTQSPATQSPATSK